MIWLLSLVGGLLNRARGSGAVPPGHQVKRVVFALATGTLLYYVGAPWEWASGAAVLFFLGLLKGWGQWMDLGRISGRRLEEGLMLSLRGLWLTGLAGGPLVYVVGLDFLPFALSGLAMGPLYELAWRIPIKWEHARQGPPLGEILFGTAVWAGAITGVVL